MKKLACFLLISILSTAFIYGQDSKGELVSSKGEYYLPEADDWSISFGVDNMFRFLGNAFNGNVKNDSQNLFEHTKAYEGSIVAKKMEYDDEAIRAIANIEFFMKTRSEEAVNLPAEARIESEDKRLNLRLGLGKEWRKGETRLQGYYGADVFLSLRVLNQSQSETFSRVQSTVNPDDIIETYTLKYSEEGFGVGLGARGFLGAEYFIFPKVALGAEYSYGVEFMYNGEGEAYNKTVVTVSGTATETIENLPATTSGFEANVGGVGVVSLNLSLYF